MENIKKLGFGLMRLPKIKDEIDIEQVKAMADLFLERGFTYFDTAYLYERGNSERAMRESVVKRYPRDRFQLADKLPGWQVKEKADLDRIFNESLERCGVSFFDYYLLHSIRREDKGLKALDDFDAWGWMQDKKAKGFITYAGFSFHGTADFLDRLLSKHPEVDFVQLQINYADWDSLSIQSRLCWETARKHNKPVVIMEPIKGGSLVTMPEKVSAIFKKVAPDASAASWAIRFAASLDGVLTVLSGMSDLSQVDDNTAYMTDFLPLTDDELATIGEVRAELKKIPTIPCTECRYCIDDCPQHINIPEIISNLNNYTLFGNIVSRKRYHSLATREGGKASDCIDCKNCEGHCPQGIIITDHLKKSAELFE